MPNLEAVGLMVSDKRDLSFVAMATTVFGGIKFFQEILKRTMAGTFL